MKDSSKIIYFALIISALLWKEGLSMYKLKFSTYFGGSHIEHARDVFSDKGGNIYIAGGTGSQNFPTTPGAFDTTRDGGGSTRGAEEFDAFVAKFDSTGTLLWSTYLGGPNYDRIYAIEVDESGYVYVAGRAGEGFPTTSGTFQPNFNGSNSGSEYGNQNGFVAKLSPDGQRLIWASYAGVGWLCRDIAIDADGDIYVNTPYEGSGNLPPQAWYSGAFQPALKGSLDNGLMKIKGDGTAVIWATWIGGSGDDHGQSTVRVDSAENVYINFMTESNDMPTSPGAFDSVLTGPQDGYVAKFSPDGSKLLMGTYVGGGGSEFMETHGLALDKAGNVYAVFATNSTDFPTTANVVGTALRGNMDVGLVKLSPSGKLLLGTYLGGSGGEGPDGIYIDPSGNVILGGETNSPIFPTTGNAFDTTMNGSRSGFFLNLAADFSKLNYSSYFGSSAEASIRGLFAGSNGNIYLTGSTNGAGLPTLNAMQNTYGGGSGGCCAIGDAFLARFIPDSGTVSNLGTLKMKNDNPIDAFRIGPRAIKIILDYHPEKIMSGTLITMNGKEMMGFVISNRETKVDFSRLDKGVYILKINTPHNYFSKTISILD